MVDREKVIKGLGIVSRMLNEMGRRNEMDIVDDALALLKEDCHNCKLECLLQKYDELKEKYDKLLKEQELPTELKQKMWNALYAEEDEYEKKYIGTDDHDAWFNIYRPWLQRGFDIAINVVAYWEGR